MKASSNFYAVTNRHNLELSFKDSKYVGYKIDGLAISGWADSNHFYETTPAEEVQFGIPSNATEDVVVLNLTNRKSSFRRRRMPDETSDVIVGPPSFISLDINMLATPDDLERLSAGTPVLMPSYSLLYDAGSDRPVMRGGIVSSDPASDYMSIHDQPARRILYQAQSADGASGAPVIAVLDSDSIVLGVNAGHYMIGLMPSGFSYCFKADCIRECIDNMQSKGTHSA